MSIDNNIDTNDIPKDMNAFTFYGLYTMICVLFIVWIIYAIFFHSRVIGYFITKFINLLLLSKKESMKCGSVTISFISGKIMFRDVQYITQDYSIKINDGFVIFRWWIPLNETISLQGGYSIHRIFCSLNGFEIFCYNRTKLYEQLAKSFECMLDKTDESPICEAQKNIAIKASLLDHTFWLTFFPVMKFQIIQGRFIVGNPTLPNNLAVVMNEGKFYYHVRPPKHTDADLFCEKIKGRASDLRVLLVKNDRYTGNDYHWPPVYIDHYYTVATCPKIEFEYHQDKPGLLTSTNQTTYPSWGLNATFNSQPTFTYGPWADKNREYLYSFFFPTFYQDVSPTVIVGHDLRVHKSFDITVRFGEEAKVDILFSKFKSTKSLNLVIKESSTLELAIPFTRDLFETAPPESLPENDSGSKEERKPSLPESRRTRFGFIRGNLEGFEAYTSMAFKPFLKCKCFKLSLDINYKSHFNDLQLWYFDLKLHDPIIYGLYNHKDFVTELIDDWGSKSERIDAMTFMPFVWQFDILMDRPHLITFTNPYNYVECQNYQSENSMTALGFGRLTGQFALRFDKFAPLTNELAVVFKAQEITMYCVIPDFVPAKPLLLNLQRESRLSVNGEQSRIRNGSTAYATVPGLDKSLWITCWDIRDSLLLNLTYLYYPLHVTTPNYSAKNTGSVPRPIPKDPVSVDSMAVSVDLDASSIYLNGALINHLLHFKENYFGEFQRFTPSPTPHTHVTMVTDLRSGNEGENLFTALDIRVLVNLTSPTLFIQKACSESLNECCPIIKFERITFLMLKSTEETKMKVALSPLTLQLYDVDCPKISDNPLRMNYSYPPSKISDVYHNRSEIFMDSVDFKARALFSRKGLSLVQESLEYAWITVFKIGPIYGDLSVAHALQLSEAFETLSLSLKSYKNESIHPKILESYKNYDRGPSVSTHTDDIKGNTKREKLDILRDAQGSYLSIVMPPNYSLETFKFSPVNLSVQSISLNIQNDDHLLALHLSTLCYASCNLIDSYLGRTMGYLTLGAATLDLYTTPEAEDDKGRPPYEAEACHSRCTMINCGYVKVPTVTLYVCQNPVQVKMPRSYGTPPIAGPKPSIPSPMIDVPSVPNPASGQKRFLTFHDSATKRLHFLYPGTSVPSRNRRGRCVDCGCYSFARCDSKDKAELDGNRFFHPTNFDTKLNEFYEASLKEISDLRGRDTTASDPIYPGSSVVKPLSDPTIGIRTDVPGNDGSFAPVPDTVRRSNGRTYREPTDSGGDLKTLPLASAEDTGDNSSFRSARSSISSTHPLTTGGASDSPKAASRDTNLPKNTSPQWVVLTGQTDRPIDKSPLFVSSYVRYLETTRQIWENGSGAGTLIPRTTFKVCRKGISTVQLVPFTAGSQLTRRDTSALISNLDGSDDRGEPKTSYPHRISSRRRDQFKGKPTFVKVKVKSFIEIQITPLAVDIAKSTLDILGGLDKRATRSHHLNILKDIHTGISDQVDAALHLALYRDTDTFYSLEFTGIKLNCLQVCLIKERVLVSQLDHLADLATCTTLFIAFFNKVQLMLSTSQTSQFQVGACHVKKEIFRATIDSVGLQLRRFENNQRKESTFPDNVNRAVISEKNSKLKFRMLPLLGSKVADSGTIDGKRTFQPSMAPSNPLIDSTGFIIFEAGIEGIKVKYGKMANTWPMDNFYPIVDVPDRSEEYQSTPLKTLDGTVNVSDIWFNFPASFYFDQNKELTSAQDDWHIFTTTSASITSWVNPAYRLTRFLQTYSSSLKRERLSLLNFLMLQTKNFGTRTILPAAKVFPNQLSEATVLSATVPSLEFFTNAYAYLFTLADADASSALVSFDKAYKRFKRLTPNANSNSSYVLLLASCHEWYARMYDAWYDTLRALTNVFFLEACGYSPDTPNVGATNETDGTLLNTSTCSSTTDNKATTDAVPKRRSTVMRRVSKMFQVPGGEGDIPGRTTVIKAKTRPCPPTDKGAGRMSHPGIESHRSLAIDRNQRLSGRDKRTWWINSLLSPLGVFNYMNVFDNVRSDGRIVKNNRRIRNSTANPQDTCLIRTPRPYLKNCDNASGTFSPKVKDFRPQLNDHKPNFQDTNYFPYENLSVTMEILRSLKEQFVSVQADDGENDVSSLKSLELNQTLLNSNEGSFGLFWAHTCMRHLLATTGEFESVFGLPAPSSIRRDINTSLNLIGRPTNTVITKCAVRVDCLLGSVKINIIECYNIPPTGTSSTTISGTIPPVTHAPGVSGSSRRETTTSNSQSDLSSNLASRRKRQNLMVNRHFSLQPAVARTMPLGPSSGGAHSTRHPISNSVSGSVPEDQQSAGIFNSSSDRYYYYTMPSSSDPRLFAFNDIGIKFTFVETFKVPILKSSSKTLGSFTNDVAGGENGDGGDHVTCCEFVTLPLIIYDYGEQEKYFCEPKMKFITNVSSFSHHINTSTLKLIYQIIWIMKNFYVVKEELEEKRNLYGPKETDPTFPLISTKSSSSKRRRHRISDDDVISLTSSSSTSSITTPSLSGCETFIERHYPDRFTDDDNRSTTSSSLPPPFSPISTPSLSSATSTTPSAPRSLSTTSSDVLELRGDALPAILPVSTITEDGLKELVGHFERRVNESGTPGNPDHIIIQILGPEVTMDGGDGKRGSRVSDTLVESKFQGRRFSRNVSYNKTSALSLWQCISDVDFPAESATDYLEQGIGYGRANDTDGNGEIGNSTQGNATQNDVDIWECHNLAIEANGHISYIRLWFGVEGLNLQFELLNLLLNFDVPSIADQRNKYIANGELFQIAKSMFLNCPQMSITLMESYSSLSNLLLNFNVVDSFLFYNQANSSKASHGKRKGAKDFLQSTYLNHLLTKTKDSVFLKFGDLKLEIPQHPIVLHEIFTRITTKLTETLNQFAFYFHQNKDDPEKNQPPENGRSPFRSSLFGDKLLKGYKRNTSNGCDVAPGRNVVEDDRSPSSPGYANSSQTSPNPRTNRRKEIFNENFNYVDKLPLNETSDMNMDEAEHHIVVNIFWKQINFEAALLPSLKALYAIKDIHMYGWKRDNIDISLYFSNHALILRSLILDPLLKLSPETQIVLPFVTIKAHYIWNLYPTLQKQFYPAITQNNIRALVKADLEIGYFERSLTTDLLNNLVFIQKVFMKEVNELLQRLTGMEQPQIPKFIEGKRQSISQEVLSTKPIPASYLYMIHLKLKGLQLTASTPTFIALRFETSAIDFKLFNQIVPLKHKKFTAKEGDGTDHHHTSGMRGQQVNKVLKRRSTKNSKAHGATSDGYKSVQRIFELKILAMLKFKISVSLGQMNQNQMYEEAESEYNPLAHFTTTISMKNTPKTNETQDTNDKKGSTSGTITEGTEVIMVGVQRPHLNVEALALDKAILIYINYKTAYEYWNEQRAALKRDVQVATQQVMEKLTTPIPQQSPKTFTQLFLQLTIDNLGISLPLQKPPNILLATHSDGENLLGNDSDHSAYFPADDPTIYMVLTIEHSRIFAFSKDVLVCKGVFTDLCTRFSFDFDPSYDDWSPNNRIVSQDKMTRDTTNSSNLFSSALMDSLVSNSCHVKEGTYEVCSNTFSTRTNNPKWVLNVNWNMKGVDFLANTYIGICLKNLIYTLTILTKEELETDDVQNERNLSPRTSQDGKIFIIPHKTSIIASPRADTKGTRASMDRKSQVIFSDYDTSPNEVVAIGKGPDTDAGQSGIPKTGEDMQLTFLKEYNDQARNLHLLKQLGASDAKIKMETDKLLNMESQVAVDYRHDIFRKLNKQSIKAALIKQPLYDEGGAQRPKSLLPSHQRQNSIACTAEPVAKGLRHYKSSSFGGEAYMYPDADELSQPSKSSREYLSAISTPENEDQFEEISPLDRFPSVTKKYSFASGSRDWNIKSSEPRLSHHQLQPSKSHPSDLYNASNEVAPYCPIEESKIDFDLDVKVNIESGTFILFNDLKDMDAFKDLLCKEKSFLKASSELCISNVSTLSQTGAAADAGNISPLGFRNQATAGAGNKHHHMPPTGTGANYFQYPYTRQSLSLLYDKIKNFIANGVLKYSSSLSLPGLDVKVKYSSHNINAPLHRLPSSISKRGSSTEKRRSSQVPPSTKSYVIRESHHQSIDPALTSNDTSQGDSCAKSADLYIWITIRTFTKENKLDPHILEFMEAVLEPIPMTDITRKPYPTTGERVVGDDEKKKKKKQEQETNTALSSDSNVVYVATTNFPVNVFVYLRVNPSSFRFSCLPISRVECIIYLPSLDLIFTSKTSDSHQSIPPNQFERYVPKKGDETKEMPLFLMKEYARAGSGISVILFLSKFSLEIFHPYGGITTKNPNITVNTFSANNLNRDTSPSKSVTTENEDVNGFTSVNAEKNKARKKFLSLEIDYIQINVMRKRILADPLDKKTRGSTVKSSSAMEESQKLVIYLSGLCDFGSASFKYDMRRLNEILVFPKAWYRKSIAKRILLGEHVSSSKTKSSRFQHSQSQASKVPVPKAGPTHKSRTLNQPPKGFKKYTVSKGASNTLPASAKLNQEKEEQRIRGEDNNVIYMVSTPQSPSSSSISSSNYSISSGKRYVEGLKEEKSRHLDANTSDDILSLASSSFQSVGSTDDALNPVKTEGFDKEKSVGKEETNLKLDPLPPIPKSALKWESLLILAIRFEKVDIQMNMGNVMGNVNWNSQGWESHSRIYMDSDHHKNFLVTFGLKESFLDAKSGIVGGDLEMKHFFQTFRLMTNPFLVQVRVANAMLHVLQIRMDYMGSTILIARISQIKASIKDDWDIQNKDEMEQLRTNRHKPIHARDLIYSRVRLHTTLKWDHFQLLICQSTQSDLQKMSVKIVEFFQHQFQSSVAILPNLKKSFKNSSTTTDPSQTKKTDTRHAMDETCPAFLDLETHYGFWLKIRKLFQLVSPTAGFDSDPIEAIKGRISLLRSRSSGTGNEPLILGGSFVFQGNHLSLACFYGINFRAKTWAIFSMREISVVFSSQSSGPNFLRLSTRDIKRVEESEPQLVKELALAGLSSPLALSHNLLFQLGFPIESDHVEKLKKLKREMAIILKISRSHYIPPKSSTIQEWCYYAFCKSSIDEVESFPAIEDRKPVIIKDFRNVTAETIFSLPRLQLNMKSEHSTVSNDNVRMPFQISVKYDFLSDFEDHILVSVDAEVLAFVHDLVISYTNKNYAAQERATKKASMSQTDIKLFPDQSDYEDARNFICNTWRLEPTLRIMSWKGQHLEAYGVDYILHKLGFTHARLTIPKWIQRGAMDPLDKFISITLYYILLKSGKFAEILAPK